MKTKSKRFLNLATLCLALLSTTLLTTQPVKAEIALAEGESTSHQTAQPISQSKLFLGSESGENSTYGHDVWRGLGHSDGYEKGKESDSPDIGDIDVPNYVSDKEAYKEGYQEGFEEGRREARPIETVLETVWQFLTDIFTDIFDGWFGSNNSSQSQ
ncbi:Uncharacterised protein [Streptococcus pyogenes]|uniref:hypothetical protein n=1 Tax=Streptococcus pyogenes TaxID=1314 RepID=UPI00109D76C0|nr:hypothetical protein [Streptococcus pyogenes]VGV33673.1 Uncharacterised protein [Streptococcus pyogenes]VGY30060.1 Uncharacterised protein [Streptococcus pyogenes]VGY35819.1 Uncharacterised protein [Streptococcus pyogenes]VGY46922.1 Uncharacterised protein [Streptococcus pyogenes]VGZ76150.1 Uncharacterised protein [Streptococcus pyogenes]